MKIIEPHLTDSYNLLRIETGSIHFRKNALSYIIPFIFPGAALVGVFITERPLLFFIFVLIPVTVLSLIAGICISNFLQYGQKRILPGFSLFLEWKTAKGLFRDAGITEPIRCGFPGYICSKETIGVEYAYTCITSTYIYTIWFASRNRVMHVIKTDRKTLPPRKRIKNPVLNLMFEHSYMVKYGSITYISQYVDILISNIDDIIRSQETAVLQRATVN